MVDAEKDSRLRNLGVLLYRVGDRARAGEGVDLGHL